MKKFSWILALSVPVFMISCQKDAQLNDAPATKSSTNFLSGTAATGNGAPSGSHYQLNIIGVPHDKTADMTNNDGRRIFVKEDGRTNIYLTQGEFGVLDANGTDKDGARFSLPAPDADLDGTTEYSVFARALGKPGGSATVTNCATDVLTQVVVCEDALDTENILEVERTAGKSRFENVTKKLLYINVDITDDGMDNPKLYPIFSPEMQDYFWQYDNSGLKVLQLRFYPVGTAVALN